MSKLAELQESMLALSPGETIAVARKDLTDAIVEHWQAIESKRGEDTIDAAISLADWIHSIGIRRMSDSYSDVVWFVMSAPPDPERD